MAWRCQVEPTLKLLTTKVIKCEPGSFKIKNTKTNGFNVVLGDTVFFPEGGGQPGDTGIIRHNETLAKVLYTYRKGSDAIHLCDTELEQGATVTLEIDWNRRFDNMQQHTGQHLISAIFDKENNATTSWYLGDEISFVELASPISVENMITAENLCNHLIRENRSVEVKMLNREDELRAGCKELPEDFAGPIRVISIDGVDQNMCCGTHLSCLAEVQCIKLLHCENGKKGRGLVWFVCGNRVFNTLNKSWNTQRSACAKLSCQVEEVSDRIDKLSLNLRSKMKENKNLWREIAIHSAAAVRSSDTKVLKLYRKDANNEFLITFVNELKDQVENGKLVFASAGEKSGNIIVLGPAEVLDKVGKEVLNVLDGKGNCKNGRLQGKVDSLKKLDAAYALINECF